MGKIDDKQTTFRQGSVVKCISLCVAMCGQFNERIKIEFTNHTHATRYAARYVDFPTNYYYHIVVWRLIILIRILFEIIGFSVQCSLDESIVEYIFTFPFLSFHLVLWRRRATSTGNETNGWYEQWMCRRRRRSIDWLRPLLITFESILFAIVFISPIWISVVGHSTRFVSYFVSHDDWQNECFARSRSGSYRFVCVCVCLLVSVLFVVTRNACSLIIFREKIEMRTTNTI